MPRKNVEPLQVHVPTGMRIKIKEYAKKHGGLSNYIRTLIEADMNEHNGPIDLEVERGPRPADDGDVDI